MIQLPLFNQILKGDILRLFWLFFILNFTTYAALFTEHKNLNTCEEFVIEKLIKIDLKTCNDLFKKAAQNFYMSIDDYGAKNHHLVHKLYTKFYYNLKPAGIILNYYIPKSNDLIRKEIYKLKKASQLPLFVGGDDCQGFVDQERTRIKINASHNSCQAQTTAAMTKVFGCNIMFNPQIEVAINKETDSNFNRELVEKIKSQIEIYKKYNIILTFKHFPISTGNFDLHKENKDFPIPYESLEKNIFPIFQKMKSDNHLLMTTHLFNSKVDPYNIVTFSKSWINILRNVLGFKNNLLITDSLDMIRHYSVAMKVGNLNEKLPVEISEEGFFAVRSILAGHDIFMTRQSLPFQQNLFSNFFQIAIANFDLSLELQKAINESYERIKTFKNKHRDLINFNPTISAKSEETIINYWKKISSLKPEDCMKPDFISATKALVRP